MIQITPHMRILVALEHVDFRKGIDTLAGVCLEKLKEDPFSGAVFVFRNRTAKAIKILTYDGQGYWLMQKRLSKGRFTWWPVGALADRPEAICEEVIQMAVYEMQLLIWNGNPGKNRVSPPWRKILKKKLDT